jgi:hypothetical protein
MLHLFVSPTPLGEGGEYPSDWTRPSRLLAGTVVTMSIAALALTLCRAIVTFL